MVLAASMYDVRGTMHDFGNSRAARGDAKRISWNDDLVIKGKMRSKKFFWDPCA